MPLEEDTHIIRVETSENAAGNTGFDEVADDLRDVAVAVVPDLAGGVDFLDLCPDAFPLGVEHLAPDGG